MADDSTFGVFGSYAVVDESGGSRSLPKRARSAPTAAPSSRRPAPSTIRLERGSAYGVAPEGCALLPGAAPSSKIGLLSVLPDELMLHVLSFLDAPSLCVVSATSHAAYAFSHAPDLWRALAFAYARADGGTMGSWVVAPSWKSAVLARAGASRMHTPLRARGVYSDLLFKHFACADAEIKGAWAALDSLPRADAATLSTESFIDTFERPSRPVVLTGAAANWPALAEWTSPAAFCAAAVGTAGPSATPALFHAGGTLVSLPDFFAYTAAVSSRDDRPLYLFERNFCELAPPLARGFSTPRFFEDDLFALLGEQRPDHTWVIGGARKSGSTFHKDPNASCAWNALVFGLKAWVFYPPHVAPPGVVVSEDGAEVATPVSVMEWYVDHFSAHSQRVKSGGPDAPLCGLQRPGDVVFVPAGWWHQVLNLEDSLAVTHNFVSPRSIAGALELARDDPAAIAGVPTSAQEGFYDALVAALAGARPEVLAAARADERVREDALVAARARPANRWTALTAGGADGGDDARVTGFSFSFSAQ